MNKNFKKKLWINKFKEMNEGAKNLGDKIWRKNFRNRNMGYKLQE